MHLRNPDYKCFDCKLRVYIFYLPRLAFVNRIKQISWCQYILLNIDTLLCALFSSYKFSFQLCCLTCCYFSYIIKLKKFAQISPLNFQNIQYIVQRFKFWPIINLPRFIKSYCNKCWAAFTFVRSIHTNSSKYKKYVLCICTGCLK